jgi:hypothetical protein
MLQGPTIRHQVEHSSIQGKQGIEFRNAALALLEALDTHRAATMGGERLEVNVTFDERGYIGSAPQIRS